MGKKINSRPVVPIARSGRVALGQGYRSVGHAPLTIAGLAVEQLIAWGVRLAFYVTGGHSVPVLRALAACDNTIECVQTRREQAAISNADFFFRSSGHLAMVSVTAGPGVTNCLTSLMTALKDGSALFLIAAEPPFAWRGRGAAQAIETAAILKHFTKSCEVLEPRRDHAGRVYWPNAAAMVRRLMTTALTGVPGPVALVVPCDAGGSLAPRTTVLACRTVPPLVEPSASEITAAADLIERVHRPLIVAGYGAVIARASSELVRLACRLGARVATSARAKGIIPESHPAHVGVLGFAGHLHARAAAARANLVLAVGTRLGELTTDQFSLPIENVPLLQLDLRRENIGLNYPVAQAIVGDARCGLASLDRELARRGLSARRSPWLVPIAANPAPPDRGHGTSATKVRSGRGISPRQAIQTVQAIAPRSTRFIVDIGAAAMCFSINELRCERPYRYHLPISLGALGTSLDGAVGAALAGKPVVVLLGDSAFEETGGAEIATAVERKLPLVIVVLDDKGNGMVQQGFERLKGRFVPAMFGVGSNYGEIARARGAHARTASTRQELAVALSAALSARRPFLVHVVIRRDPGDPTPMGNRAAALATFSPPAADSDRDLARGTSRVQAKRR